MRFEGDEAKRLANLEKQGVDLLVGAPIFEGSTVEAPDLRQDRGEERMIALGPAHGALYVIVYDRRGDAIRLIATRKGGRRDRRRFENALSG